MATEDMERSEAKFRPQKRHKVVMTLCLTKSDDINFSNFLTSLY